MQEAASGLTAAKAAEHLHKDGPNTLPAEKSVPGWLRRKPRVLDLQRHAEELDIARGLFAIRQGRLE